MRRAILHLLSSILILAAIGCAAARPAREYQIGEIRVRLYSTAASLAENLPQEAQIALVGKPQGWRYFDFFDRKEKVLYAIDEVEAVLHGIKHYLEPFWSHAEDCPSPARCLEPR